VASKLKGEANLAIVDIDDAQNEATLGKRFNISSYPSIKYFPIGFKSDSDVLNYESIREEPLLISWITD